MSAKKEELLNLILQIISSLSYLKQENDNPYYKCRFCGAQGSSPNYISESFTHMIQCPISKLSELIDGFNE